MKHKLKMNKGDTIFSLKKKMIQPLHHSISSTTLILIMMQYKPNNTMKGQILIYMTFVLQSCFYKET